MQHQVISYSTACDLIEKLDATEVHSAGWAQTFRAENKGKPIYIQLPGEEPCLLIAEKRIPIADLAQLRASEPTTYIPRQAR